MKKKKILFLIIILFVLIGIIMLVKSTPQTKNNSLPHISLNNSKIITLSLGQHYQEDGYKAYDKNDGDLTKQVKVISDIDYDTPGTYQILYQVKNSSGVVAEARRYIVIKSENFYKDDYDKIDNKVRHWWNNNRGNNTRPIASANSDKLKPYNAYYIGKDKKVMYLTFDENEYIDEIVKILDKNKVKGTFFVTSNFLNKNKDLVKKMVKNNHLIGNLTSNYSSAPNLTKKTDYNILVSEIINVEKLYEEITDEDIPKIFRFPNFEWSYRSMQIIKDLGYKTYFHSADLDIKPDSTAEYVLNEFMKTYHNGAIYWVEVNNGNVFMALDSFIKEMKDLGYKFALINEI